MLFVTNTQACKAIKTRLYPHQMSALAWMAHRENKTNVGVAGGILADDMGLGKSLTILALVLTNYHDGRPLARPMINFSRVLDRGVLRFLPKRDRGAANEEQERREDEILAREVGSKLRSGEIQGLSIAKLLGKKTDQRSKIKSSSNLNKKRPKLSAIAVLSGACGGASDAPPTKESIDRDLAQIDESLLSGDESPDEFDSMLEGSGAATLSQRLGVDEETLTSGGSQDEATPKKPFKSEMNVDGATELDSDSDDEDFVAPISKMKRKRVASSSDEEENEDSSSESKVVIKGEKSKNPNDDDNDEELPDLDAPSTSASNGDQQTNDKSPPPATLTSDVVAAPLLSPEQTRNLIVPPSKPSLRGKRPGGTLIVTPASLLSHWIEQIEAHVDKR